jgi:hypothetical protein
VRGSFFILHGCAEAKQKESATPDRVAYKLNPRKPKPFEPLQTSTDRRFLTPVGVFLSDLGA